MIKTQVSDLAGIFPAESCFVNVQKGQSKKRRDVWPIRSHVKMYGQFGLMLKSRRSLVQLFWTFNRVVSSTIMLETFCYQSR